MKEDVCIRELRAILACDQSDGYLKERAKYWIEEIEYETSLAVDLEQVPAVTALSQHKLEQRGRHAYGQVTPLFTENLTI